MAELGLDYAPPPAPVLAEHRLSPEISRSGSTVTLSAPSAVDRIYQLQRRSSLTLGEWENRGMVKTGTGDFLEFTDAAAAEEGPQFYRLLIE